MGDGKAVSLRSPSRTSATSSTARRSRYLAGSSRLRSFHVEPPPVVLHLTSTLIRAGLADPSQPQHAILLGQYDINNKTNNEYSRWSQILQDVYSRLLVAPKSRRVGLVSLDILLAQQNAIRLWLWNQQVPALVHYSSLQVVPVALGSCRHLLLLEIGRDESHCAVSAEGHLLEFTRHCVPGGYLPLLQTASRSESESTNRTDTLVTLPPAETLRIPSWRRAVWNPRAPTSLLYALLRTLSVCPRDLRSPVIGNFVVVGEGAAVLPDLARGLALALQQVLQQQPIEQDDVDEVDDSAAGMTMWPLSLEPLRPLASRVRLVSTHPHRPDHIAWMGASLWAAAWNNKYEEDDDEDKKNVIPWTYPPTTSTTTEEKTTPQTS